MDVEFIVLAGYMRHNWSNIAGEYEGRIVNIHPSLLPAFPGKDAIGQALAAKVKWSGVTVHYVDEGMDTGPIIVRNVFQLMKMKQEKACKQKIHTIEHKLYPASCKC